MKLNDYKLAFIAVGLIGVLLLATPAIADAFSPPGGEPFSELHLLGPNKMAEDYPFNVAVDQNYSIYAGVTNNMGSLAYYVLNVKLMNQTDLYPNRNTGTPSSVLTLYEINFALRNGQSWACPISFSVTNASFSHNQCVANKLVINNIMFGVNKPALWDTNTTKFSYQLLFELWIYNSQSGSVEYNNLYVSLQFNLTQTT